MKVTQEKENTKQNADLTAGESAAPSQLKAGLTPPPFQMKASAIQMKQGEGEEEPTQLKEAPQTAAHDNGCGCAQCKMGSMQSKDAAPVEAAQLQAQGKGPLQRKAVAQMKPGYLVYHNFMGISVEVNTVMRTRLTNVQADLQRQYDAEDPATRPATLLEWSGLSTIRGYRPGTGKHGSGSAVDCNYDNQPYIPTRTGTPGHFTYGGEEGKATTATRALRQPATEVYDRATNFMRTNPYESETAEVGIRGTGESTADVYDRFKHASDSLASYMSLAFLTNFNTVTRRPVANPETASEADLLSGIPTTERKDEATAVAAIQAIMDDPFWLGTTTNTARQQWIRILRDYEIVRTPLQRGDPTTNPSNTRNPALGFLHMKKPFVVAMADIGHLRWGVCDFGATASGDIHHFDLGQHGDHGELTPE